MIDSYYTQAIRATPTANHERWIWRAIGIEYRVNKHLNVNTP